MLTYPYRFSTCFPHLNRRKLELEASAPKGLPSAVKPNATTSNSTSRPPTRPAAAIQPAPATKTLSAMDITYARDQALYEAQYKVFSQKMGAMTKECNALAKSRDNMQRLIDKIPDPAVRKVYKSTLESIAAKLASSQTKL